MRTYTESTIIKLGNLFRWAIIARTALNLKEIPGNLGKIGKPFRYIAKEKHHGKNYWY